MAEAAQADSGYPQRRSEDPRIDRLERDVRKLSDRQEHLEEATKRIEQTTTELTTKTNQNAIDLAVIRTQTEPLKEIAVGVKGLQTFARLLVSVASVVTAVTVIGKLFNA